ncbi:TonB-dependent receptor [Maribacter sp. 2307ULW6-5]|uniref:TonB-dependent receptor n=1 Tax=Maribacter sp. 2307ULW6-5 TaxID=3386275 RepID=UPI0039BD53E0
MRTVLLLTLMLMGSLGHAQTTINGTVMDENNVPIPAANIVVVGTTVGTVTDFDGNFALNTSETPPFELRITSLGYTEEVVPVTQNNQTINVILREAQTFLDEVVISASRTPERIFESPVTVERMGLEAIRNTASADFYGGLENLKGVDINTNSLTFKSVNTRGFATFANTRFMQLVDGMDNSTPALNFPIGNLAGLVEPDVLSVELLPGAASALYGANAFNGILFMRSKSPFDYTGISASVKRGFTSQEAAGNNAYTDVGIRAAHKFSDKFAIKWNFGYLDGTDWAATSEVDRFMPGRTRDALNYDGINVYGDEVSTDIKDVALTLEGLGILPAGANALVPSVQVSRTGYNERDLTDYTAQSIKTDWGLFYRPIEGNSLELSYVGKVGTGNTIYQGTNRYNIANFFQEQHKFEIRNDNFFVRGYMVGDKAGDSYDMVFTGININRSWKDDNTWFGEYTGTFVQATLAGATQEQAHAAARAQAETGRLLPGTAGFQEAFDRVIRDPDLSRGSQFRDASKYYHADANYNFGHLWDWAEVQVGGSFRQFRLNSFGTIYTDTDGPIEYNEFGLYTQMQKNIELAGDQSLKLTGSLRYDKNQFFDGFFSPRFSAGYTLNRNHNIRASVQTGFRNPTTQDLFIGLDAGRAILVGAAPDNLDRYSREYEVSRGGQLLGQPANLTQTGRAAYENSFSANSVQRFAASGNVADIEIGSPDVVQPEQVTSVEVGYRGKVDKLVIDFSTYYNQYRDFLSPENVIAPLYGTVGDNSLSLAALANSDFVTYQAYTNSDADIASYGASLGLSAKVLGGFDLSGSYTFTRLDFDRAANPDFQVQFNTPEHQFKASFGHTELFKNFGFNVNYRFSDDYYWEATFGNGLIPEFHVVDAQINYAVPKIKSVFKIGANNLLGDEYFTAFGTGFVGSIYYASWIINN